MSENEVNKSEKEDLSLLEKSLKSRRILLSEDVN